MAYLLDILGSTTIAAAIIFMVMQFNARINDSSVELLMSTISQGDALVSAEIMQHDLYKMGLNVSENSILVADSNRIKFLTDLDNDGSTDSIIFVLGSKNDLVNTTNPYDRPIIRKINQDSSYNLLHVSEFNISYFDSIGTEISTAQLINQSARNRIKTISLYCRAESPEPIDSIYHGIDWFRNIRPRNL